MKTVSRAIDRKKQDGFTLVEALVVLAITGMIATVLVQGLGAVLAGRAAVAAKITGLDRTMLERSILTEPIKGIVPDYAEGDSSFRGGKTSLSGLTLRPLEGAAGAPTGFSMYFEYDNINHETALIYRETTSEPRELFRWFGNEGGFLYRDRSGDWQMEWNDEKGNVSQTPWLIRVDMGKEFPPTVIVSIIGPHDRRQRLEDIMQVGIGR